VTARSLAFNDARATAPQPAEHWRDSVLVAEESCFALKGGTAINFFVRDMPRLSVDIDLVYLPVKDRRSSLAEIESALTHWRLSTKKPATIELSLGGHRADKDGWIAAGRELRGRVPGEASRAYGHAGDGRRWNGRKDTLSIGRRNRVGVPKRETSGFSCPAAAADDRGRPPLTRARH
jgi:hypothetical protein